MHNKQLENLMITFPSSTLKDIANKKFINNSILELRFTQIYSHLRHIRQKDVNLVKYINSLFKQHGNINKYICWL
jgi:hypothetical protein